jgi:hypothetical protein
MNNNFWFEILNIVFEVQLCQLVRQVTLALSVMTNEKQNVGKDNESDDTKPKNDPNH